MVKIISCCGFNLSDLRELDGFDPDGIDYSHLIREEKNRRKDEITYDFPQPSKPIKISSGRVVKVKTTQK